MKLKHCLMVPLIIAPLIVLSGCKVTKTEPKVNKTSIVEVILAKDRTEVVGGKYLLRFDTGLGQYMKLKEELEGLLLKDWEVRTPEALLIQARSAVVKVVEHEEEVGAGLISTSQVYEIYTTLTITAAPEAAASQSSYDVVVSFPGALLVGQTLKASAPSEVPEVRFHVLYYPKNSGLGFSRIGKDFGLTVLFAILAAAAGFSRGGDRYTGYMLIIGVIGTFYFLFMTLRDLWWITSRWWGG